MSQSKNRPRVDICIEIHHIFESNFRCEKFNIGVTFTPERALMKRFFDLRSDIEKKQQPSQ